MRLLLLNPNTSQELTDRLTAVAEEAKAPDTTITAVTAPRGFAYISSRAEAEIAGAIALEMIAERVESCDAVVIAAFADPGLKAARELFDVPVVGMAEAALLTACMLGERFGIVTFTPRLTPWYFEAVQSAGLAERFAGFRTPPAAQGDIGDVAERMAEELGALTAQMAKDDGADVVILGGAPVAGLAARLRSGAHSAVLLDPVSAAVKQAEALATVAPQGASHGSYARPPGKASQGLPRALAQWIVDGPSGG